MTGNGTTKLQIAHIREGLRNLSRTITEMVKRGKMRKGDDPIEDDPYAPRPDRKDTWNTH
jgi:hypothetical protein